MFDIKAVSLGLITVVVIEAGRTGVSARRVETKFSILQGQSNQSSRIDLETHPRIRDVAVQGTRFMRTSPSDWSHEEAIQFESVSLWQQMEGYMQALQGLPSADQKTNNLKIAILQNLKPHTTCHSPKRYGEPNDGGYAMCSELLENNKVTAGYSIGVNGYDGWGKDISTQLHVPVYQFDCTNPQRPMCNGCDFHFYDLCVAASSKLPDDARYKTIQDLMALNGHGKRGDTKDLAMQIDVEGYEWNLFADPSTAGAMLESSQVSLEFHGVLSEAKCCKGSSAPLETKLKALENMNKHFVVAHVHGNNYEGVDTIGDYSIPKVIEVLYIRRGLAKEQPGTADPKYWPQDAKNWAEHPDVQTPHLPAALAQTGVSSGDLQKK